MTEKANTYRWGIPEIIEIVDTVDTMMAENITGTITALDYRNLVYQTMGKAILTMREILVLLYNGYPDGALSRGRTIYEQAVILTFIEKNLDAHGNELLERYYDDYQVKRISNLLEVRRFFLQADNLDLKKKLQNGLREMEQKQAALKDKYSEKKSFSQYWWANVAIPSASFAKLSKDSDFGFLQILYNRACISTHSSAMGDFALLGRDNPDGSKIFTSPTFDGFESPLFLALGSFGILLEATLRIIPFDGSSLLQQINKRLEILTLSFFKKE